MTDQLRLFVAGGILSLVAACAMQQPVALQIPVGSSSTMVQTKSARNGFLTVYTATKTYLWGEDVNDIYQVALLADLDGMMTYRVHSDYTIYDAGGHLLVSVRNAEFYHDPHPRVVELPEGNYLIQGWGDRHKLIRVPVVIKASRMTIVNLETNQNKRFRGVTEENVVRAPDGTIIGWVASPTL